MLKVDFHIIEQASGLKSLLYTCQLIEKAYEDHQLIYLFTHSREEAEQMDALLWTYRDDSFLPHSLYNAANDSSPPIQIGFTETHPQHGGMLINLSRDIPDCYQKFNPVIEIVFSDPIVQQLARERFKKYRDQGCEINTYKIKANAL